LPYTYLGGLTARLIWAASMALFSRRARLAAREWPSVLRERAASRNGVTARPLIPCLSASSRADWIADSSVALSSATSGGSGWQVGRYIERALPATMDATYSARGKYPDAHQRCNVSRGRYGSRAAPFESEQCRKVAQARLRYVGGRADTLQLGGSDAHVDLAV